MFLNNTNTVMKQRDVMEHTGTRPRPTPSSCLNKRKKKGGEQASERKGRAPSVKIHELLFLFSVPGVPLTTQV